MSNIVIKNAAIIFCNPANVKRGSELDKARLLSNASLVVTNGEITCLCNNSELESRSLADHKFIDATDKIVLPGFIDSHTHLVFAGSREQELYWKIAGESYQGIAEKGGGIISTVTATRKASKAQLKAIAKNYLKSALECGTTTIEVKSGYGLDLETEIKILQVVAELNNEQPLDLIPTFMGAHMVPPGINKSQYVEDVCQMIPQVADLATFCDMFCETGYFDFNDAQMVFNQARNHGLVPRLHLDQFSSSGQIADFIGLKVKSIDHLEMVSDVGISAIGGSDVCATLLPGVSFFLRYQYAPARKLINAGAIIALASDFNPGTSMINSMQMVISLAVHRMGLSPTQAINAVTTNAAYALGIEKRVGTISPGMQADLIILDVPNIDMIAYHFGKNHVQTVIKAGNIIWNP